jgi:hypothetical protein
MSLLDKLGSALHSDPLLLERAVAALEGIAASLARACPPPLPDRTPYMATLSDLQHISDERSGELVEKRRDWERERGIVPGSELSMLGQLQVLDEEYARIRRDTLSQIEQEMKNQGE